MTPQSVSKTGVDVLNTLEASYSSPIKRKIGDLEEEDDKDDVKKRMTGGWLKTIVQDANVNVFGVLQICGRQENILTLLKVSDGECVTWQATATIHHGYRLIIKDFEFEFWVFESLSTHHK